MMPLIFIILLVTLGYAQGEVSNDDYAKILRLLASDLNLGYLQFGDDIDPEMKSYYELLAENNILLLSPSTSATIQPSYILVELSNPDQNDTAFNEYIQTKVSRLETLCR